MAALVWNGSFLGEFSADAIQSMEVRDKEKYWTLDLGTRVTCRVKSTKTSFPNVIDELKSLFGLPKLGTHQIRMNHKNYILIRCPEPGVSEVPLHQFIPELSGSQYPLFRRQIQEILAFRDVLAVPVTYESSLRVRIQPRRHPVPLSYREPSMAFDSSKPILSASIQNRWFNDANVSQTLARMIRIDPEDVATGISEFRTHLETIISRVDKSLIWCSAFIIERLMSRLLNDSPNLLLHPSANLAVPTSPASSSGESPDVSETSESTGSIGSPIQQAVSEASSPNPSV